ncbi:MAG: 30S ribosomal protein S17 [Candidatus Omnitrophica bacterium]|nr:30S ribosomal protein S17 [Candidatus Omnitrophota bacterium]
MQVSRGKRKEKQGVVIGDKMDKTITVQVARLVRHAWLGKSIRKYSKFKAHDENREAKVGDIVSIIETRPLSKTKRWRLVKVVKKK